MCRKWGLTGITVLVGPFSISDKNPNLLLFSEICLGIFGNGNSIDGFR